MGLDDPDAKRIALFTRGLKVATQMVKEGRGDDFMDKEFNKEARALVTAQKMFDLFGKGVSTGTA